MKFNTKQRATSIIAAAALLAIGALWLGTGAHVFTKQQIPVEHTDELLGTTYVTWEDAFTVGLDMAIPGVIAVSIVAALAMFFLRTRKKFTDLTSINHQG